MKIIHRYIISQFLKTLAFALSAFTLLFLLIDFFDRIDNMLPQSSSLLTIGSYFLFKIPQVVSLTLPVSMLVALLFSIGLLAKNSEITAMRASGIRISWIARPLFVLGLCFSLGLLAIKELLVPYSARRVKEIYNIDIKQKHTSGGYSQTDFWWRTGNEYYSVAVFDSRDNTLFNLTKLELNSNLEVLKRTEAKTAKWLNGDLGWSMQDVTEYNFKDQADQPKLRFIKTLPLPISEHPEDFYEARTEPDTMSYRQLKKFIRQQLSNGGNVRSFFADLYGKVSFPFVMLVLCPLVLPFALKPARSGNMAVSFVAALVIGFSYYFVHSFSLALGRADILPPLLAAWVANLIMGFVGVVLMAGAEAPA